ncbi:unnamed protein product [Hymenolepis diminuta]|uniref:Uncharacterized protein n=3 Tax=Hymenolepis diminuta TaxID=6216 RepID=A0A564Y7X6_HYMDI|nr:unnamed protein product [Hymenolepis diminuta]
MSDTDENISLKDKYESLKLLCSEQVLANELLKDEMEKLRKKLQEVSRHRAFLLEKLVKSQSKTAQNSAPETKRSVKSSSNQNPQNRNAQSQPNRAPPIKLRTPAQRPKAYPREEMPYEESDPESDNTGDFGNGWEDDFNHMPGPSYRRPQCVVQPPPPPPKNVKRPQPPPPVKMSHPQPHPPHTPAFKRPRIIDNEPGPSSRGSYGNNFHQHQNSGMRSQMSYDYSGDNGSDFSEDPPIIYSKSASSTVSSYPANESGVSRRPAPSILRPASASVSGGNVSDRLFNHPRPPSVSGNSSAGPSGYYGSRLH